MGNRRKQMSDFYGAHLFSEAGRLASTQKTIDDPHIKAFRDPCPGCVFHTQYGCEFEFYNKWLSAERVPDGCPRGLAQKTSYRFYEYVILGEMEHNGKRMTFEEICQLFPYMKQRVVLKILRRMKREGKISHVRCGSMKIYDQRNVWKIGHAFGGSYR